MPVCPFYSLSSLKLVGSYENGINLGGGLIASTVLWMSTTTPSEPLNSVRNWPFLQLLVHSFNSLRTFAPDPGFRASLNRRYVHNRTYRMLLEALRQTSLYNTLTWVFMYVCLCSLNLFIITLSGNVPIFRRGNLGSEKLSYLHKVRQLVNDPAETRTQSCHHSLCFQAALYVS